MRDVNFNPNCSSVLNNFILSEEPSAITKKKIQLNGRLSPKDKLKIFTLKIFSFLFAGGW